MIYFIMISALIGSINDNIGISILSGIKINVTDILFMIFFFCEFIIKKKKLRKFMPIKYILLLIILMSISILWGIFNESEVTAIVRVLRNYMYILLMFWLAYSNYKNKSSNIIYKDLIIMCWIAIINCLIEVTIGFIDTNWFIHYRQNPTFQVFMFLFLILYKVEKNESINNIIIRRITILFLGLCIFFSQERLQIVAIAIGIFLGIIYRIANSLLKKQIKINIYTIKNNLIMGTIIIFFMILILRIEYVQDYINHFVKYRVNSVLSTNGFEMDGSLSARSIQFINILNVDWINWIFGKGLCSLYISATGPIHIVDSLWLWIFKDLGVIGIFILMTIYLSIYVESTKVRKNSKAFKVGLVGIMVLQIFTPNIMLLASDAIFIGYILSMICLMSEINYIRTS